MALTVTEALQVLEQAKRGDITDDQARAILNAADPGRMIGNELLPEPMKIGPGARLWFEVVDIEGKVRLLSASQMREMAHEAAKRREEEAKRWREDAKAERAAAKAAAEAVSMNDGHPFIGVERLREFLRENTVAQEVAVTMNVGGTLRRYVLRDDVRTAARGAAETLSEILSAAPS